MADDAASNTVQPPPPPPHIYRPIPRRTFDAAARNDSADSPTHAYTQATPPGTHETSRSSDFLAQLNARLLRTYDARNVDTDEQDGEEQPPPRNKSLLNMTSSTLFGIYDEDVGEGTTGDRSMIETPWGTGAETPAHTAMGLQGAPAWEIGLGSPDGGLSIKSRARSSVAHRVDAREKHPPKPVRQGPWKYAVITGKLAALYLFGAIYGLIVSQLHETRQLAAVHVEGVDRRSRLYLPSWGLFGLVLGSLLPYVDLVWDSRRSDNEQQGKEAEKHESPISEQINDVVRSVAAFVGIAFAIRRLPWQSNLQLTLTLALVNPALWYILDRSKPGLSFSLIVTSILTSLIFLSNPNALPSPPLPSSTNVTRLPPSQVSRLSPTSTSANGKSFAGVVSYENLAVVTWVGSVLFCSCVCFGNIGRRLGVLEGSSSKR
ncbi:hypothetical protein T440DRAFT_496015 [Plenodomus tracheiphilus IPT5]|uniref:INSIG domain-containing protein n=1 Tax=Plenodomus tracheiphilus IPT5 TaxID=1408161 RepID=A0A6A7BGT1_9PLEO|nr:hypothetical protein T440DRAFT_496015 [Plenodomus tracheiphilus IPT5]